MRYLRRTRFLPTFWGDHDFGAFFAFAFLLYWMFAAATQVGISFT